MPFTRPRSHSPHAGQARDSRHCLRASLAAAVPSCVRCRDASNFRDLSRLFSPLAGTHHEGARLRCLSLHGGVDDLLHRLADAVRVNVLLDGPEEQVSRFSGSPHNHNPARCEQPLWAQTAARKADAPARVQTAAKRKHGRCLQQTLDAPSVSPPRTWMLILAVVLRAGDKEERPKKGVVPAQYYTVRPTKST